MTKQGGFWKLMRRMNDRMMIRLLRSGKGPVWIILLLTTRGRKSGQPRSTPLQYEKSGDDYIVASGRGKIADWYANIQAEPRVEVLVRGKTIQGTAETVTDAVRIADFFELRLRRHPVMFRLLLLMEGVAPWAGRMALEQLAARKTMVVIHPDALP